jgi:hypothetical protein
MPRERSRPLEFALLCAAACTLCVAASCSQDGVTTNCPALPRYDAYPLGDASIQDAMSGDSAASKEELAAAVAAGCATGPNGVGSAAGGSAGKGGTGGSTGNAGSGGTLGSGGEGGSNSADSAGAAGRN